MPLMVVNYCTGTSNRNYREPSCCGTGIQRIHTYGRSITLIIKGECNQLLDGDSKCRTRFRFGVFFRSSPPVGFLLYGFFLSEESKVLNTVMNNIAFKHKYSRSPNTIISIRSFPFALSVYFCNWHWCAASHFFDRAAETSMKPELPEKQSR